MTMMAKQDLSVAEEKLLNSSKSGNRKELTEAIAENVNINVTDEEQNTALHHATTEGHVDCVIELLKVGANTEINNNRLRKPLHEAARHGRSQCLDELLRAGAKPESKDIYEQTPLHWASAKGHIRCVEELIKVGVDVNLIKDNGFNALKLALVYGHEETVKVLMAAGATNDDNIIHPMTMTEYKSSEEMLEKDTRGVEEFADSSLQEKVAKGIKSVDKGLPWEIQNLDSISANLFAKLLQEDSYELYDTRSMIVGEQGVGKTTLANFLVGNQSNHEKGPTDGIQLFKGLAFLNRQTKQWLTGNQEFNLDDLIISRMLKSNPLKHQKQKQDVVKQCESLVQQTDEKLATHHKDEINLDGMSKEKKRKVDESEDQLPLGIDTVKNVKVSITQEVLLKRSWDVGEKKIHKLHIIPIIIWDFGGQDVFYATHQTFLTYRAIYMIVINGSRPLNQEVILEQYLPGKSGRKTSRDYLMFWVKTILTYCKRSNDGFPKLLVVATHKDKVENQEIVEEVRGSLYDEIEKMFADSNLKNHLLTKYRLFVNANDHNDPEMSQLKTILTEMAFEQPNWGEKMPACFLPLEMELTALTEKADQKVISVNHIEKLNSLLPIRSLSKTELQLFLKVQHALGKLLYFPVPALDDKVILAPTHLIDAFRSIVTDRQFCGNDKTRLTLWEEMASKGVIKKEAIDFIWQKDGFRHFWEDRDYLLKLMAHLDILSEPRRYDKRGNLLEGDLFLVPSMVREADNTLYFKSPYISERIICLSFICLNDILPPALCYRFITYCISIWSLKRYGECGEKQMLFEDVAVLVVDSSTDMSVHCSEDRILVRLIHEENKSLISEGIASSIRECLTNALQNISQLYQQLCFIEQGSNKVSTQSTFSIEPCCAAPDRPCSVNDRSKLTSTKVWKCPRHGIEHSTRSLFAWFVLKDKGEECSKDARCPVLDEEFLCRCPNDLHLRRLSLEVEVDEIRELCIYLGMKSKQWDILQMNHTKMENVMFESLIKWRDSSDTGTFNDIKTAMEGKGMNIHKICKVLRERFIDFEDPSLDRYPTDEDVDKLAPFIGSDSLHFLVELGLEFQDWEQIRYKSGQDLVKTNRTIINYWKEKCENNFGIKPSMRLLFKAFANIGKSQRVVEKCLLKRKVWIK